MLVGKLLEVGAAVELLDDRLGLFLRLHEDVTGMHLVDRRRAGDFLVIAGTNLGVGDLVDDTLLDQLAMQRTLLQERHAALEIRILVEAGGDRLGGHDAVRAALTGHSLPQFVAVLAQVDALLCGDTLALHVASGLRVPTVCVIGPTSAAEIGDFDGLILKVSATELDCLCCYGDCQKAANCMSLLDIDELVRLTTLQLDREQAGENRARNARLAAGAGA